MFGCLRRFIILVVVLFAVGYYVFDTYGNQIYEKAKVSFLDFVFNDIDSYDISDKETYLELKTLADEYLDELKEQDFSDSYDKVKAFFTEIKNYLDDKELSDFELEKLKKIIENER